MEPSPVTAGTLGLYFNIKHVLKSFQQPKRTRFCLIFGNLVSLTKSKDPFFATWNWFHTILDSISISVLRTSLLQELLWFQLNGCFQCLPWEMMSESFYEMLNSNAFIHPASVFGHVWQATVAAQKRKKTFLILFLYRSRIPRRAACFSPLHLMAKFWVHEVIGWGD